MCAVNMLDGMIVMRRNDSSCAVPQERRSLLSRRSSECRNEGRDDAEKGSTREGAAAGAKGPSSRHAVFERTIPLSSILRVDVVYERNNARSSQDQNKARSAEIFITFLASNGENRPRRNSQMRPPPGKEGTLRVRMEERSVDQESRDTNNLDVLNSIAEFTQVLSALTATKNPIAVTVRDGENAPVRQDSLEEVPCDRALDLDLDDSGRRAVEEAEGEEGEGVGATRVSSRRRCSSCSLVGILHHSNSCEEEGEEGEGDSLDSDCGRRMRSKWSSFSGSTARFCCEREREEESGVTSLESADGDESLSSFNHAWLEKLLSTLQDPSFSDSVASAADISSLVDVAVTPLLRQEEEHSSLCSAEVAHALRELISDDSMIETILKSIERTRKEPVSSSSSSSRTRRPRGTVLGTCSPSRRRTEPLSRSCSTGPAPSRGVGKESTSVPCHEAVRQLETELRSVRAHRDDCSGWCD